MNNLLILGAGAHGKVVAEAAELERKWDKISFIDDRDDIQSIYDFSIVGKIDDYINLIDEYEYAFVAIGNNEKRVELIDKLISAGFKIPSIIHPRASVSKYSQVDVGTVILAGAVVNVSTTIGKGCIININASIDHDCEIAGGVHISTGAVVRSMCKIDKLCTIGAGACIKSGGIIKEKLVVSEGIII